MGAGRKAGPFLSRDTMQIAAPGVGQVYKPTRSQPCH